MRGLSQVLVERNGLSQACPMRTGVVVLGVVLLWSARAFAGDCDGEGTAEVVAFERYAKKPGPPKPALDELCVDDEIAKSPLLIKRFLSACDRILAREPMPECIWWGTSFGAKALGGKDLFEELRATFPLRPFDFERAERYATLGDPRAVALVVSAWKAALVDKRLSRHTHEWARWRRAALALLEQHGGPSESAFLAAQLPATSGKSLLQALQAAITAIDRRAAAVPPLP